MKLSTSLILMLVAAISYLLFKPGPPPPEPVVATPPPSTPVAVATPPGKVMPPLSRTVWRPEELVMLRGRVDYATPDGLIIGCEPPGKLAASRSPTGVSSTADNAGLESRIFGTLKVFEKGTLKVSNWEPSGAATGVVLLMGYPEGQGIVHNSPLNVVAAPVDELYPLGANRLQAYTMKFATSAGGEGTSGLWKWQPRGSLDRGTYDQK